MLQVCQPCISLHITHSSQIQKCTVIWSWYLRDAHRTLACQHPYSLSKTPSRFYEKIEILYYSYMDDIHFSTWEFKISDIDQTSKSCIDHSKYVEALLSCKSFEQELTILCQINEIHFGYTFLRGSCENGGGRAVLCLWDQQD